MTTDGFRNTHKKIRNETKRRYWERTPNFKSKHFTPHRLFHTTIATLDFGIWEEPWYSNYGAFL
jgi:hypothetical protein